MLNGALRKSSVPVFKKSFASIDKIFVLGGLMGTRLYFHEVLCMKFYTWEFKKHPFKKPMKLMLEKIQQTLTSQGQIDSLTGLKYR